MKPGMIVAIYCDPLTEQQIEGEAKLKRCLDNNCGKHNGRRLERWRVIFNGDHGLWVDRNILSID